MTNQKVGCQSVCLEELDDLAALNEYDALISRWSLSYPSRIVVPDILDLVEDEMGLLIFPDRNTRWSWDNKLRQKLQFEHGGFRMPKTWVFFDYMEALDWATNAPYPVVFKLASGASSRNVILVRNQKEAERLISRIFGDGIRTRESLATIRDRRIARRGLTKIKQHMKEFSKGFQPSSKEIVTKSYAYFQEFIAENKFDTRISVIGDRAFGYRRFNRPNDFRASGSGNFETNPDDVSLEAVRIAFAISRRFAFQSMAYDFIQDSNGEWLVLEMCWTFVDWMVQKCPGHWNPNLDWIPGPMWPQEAQIEDLIKLVETRRR